MSWYRDRMSTTPSISGSRDPARADGGPVPFRWPAFLLGLVLPGLGHWSMGEKGRAARILTGFMILWFGGLLIGGPMSVTFMSPRYANPGAIETRRLWFLPQAGGGPIAFVTAAAAPRLVPMGEEDVIEVTLPDRSTGVISKHTPIGHAADFGTLFCALAGLMNIAVALDAGRRPEPERRRGSS